jgi:hypothetical protein
MDFQRIDYKFEIFSMDDKENKSISRVRGLFSLEIYNK